MKKLLVAALAGLSLAMSLSAAGAADDKKVVIAYQTGSVPYFVGIANGEFAKKTGWDIEFRRFNSGAEIFAAIASGDVQIGDVGSSPFAAAVSRGIDVKGFFISSVSGDGEALVVRPGIETPADLKGKKLAAAPVSTDHYQLLAVLKQEGISEKEAQVIAIPQPEIVAAWKRGDIDGAFVWDPALTELKKDGKVLLTVGPGRRAWRADLQRDRRHWSVLSRSIRISSRNTSDLVDSYFRSYTNDAGRLEAGLRERQADLEPAGRHSRRIRRAVKTTIGRASAGRADVRQVARRRREGGVAKILKDTADFLKDQHKITAVKDSYAGFADPQYAEAAKAMSN